MGNYTVDVRKLCTHFDAQYVLRFVRELAADAQAEHTFIFRGVSDLDLLAQADYLDGVQADSEQRTLGGQIALVVRTTKAMRCWDLRRFVVPPAGYRAFWAEPVDVKQDPMFALPTAILNELYREVQKHVRSQQRLIEDELPEADLDAETAAPKSSPAPQ